MQVEDWLSRSSGIPLEELRPYLFLLKDRDATHHLMRVSGGLDSLVMGEGQILAQVSHVACGDVDSQPQLCSSKRADSQACRAAAHWQAALVRATWD